MILHICNRDLRFARYIAVVAAVTPAPVPVDRGGYNTKARWLQREDKVLQEMYDAGISGEVMAESLGRSVNAIRSRLQALQRV